MAKRPKDRDVAEDIYKAKAFLWAIAAGVPLGLLGAVAWGLAGGGGGILPFIIGILGGPTAIYQGVIKTSWGTAKFIGNIYHPDGSSIAPKRDYSLAKAHTARGRYEDAAAAWELYVTEYPEDPIPYIELGRLHRNQLKDYDQAMDWYRRARTDAQVSDGQYFFLTQEIVEILSQRLGTPRKAIPELVDVIKQFPDHPDVDGARKQLEELREGIRRELE